MDFNSSLTKYILMKKLHECAVSSRYKVYIANWRINRYTILKI